MVNGTVPCTVAFPAVQAVAFSGTAPAVSLVPRYPTFAASVSSLTPTASTNVMVIEAGSALTTRLRRIVVTPGNGTNAGYPTLTLSRNSVAATTGGTTGTIPATDLSQGSFSGVVRTGGFSTSGVTTAATAYVFPLPTPAVGNVGAPFEFDFTNNGMNAGLAIPAGTTNGVMFTHSGLTGAQYFGLLAEWAEESTI